MGVIRLIGILTLIDSYILLYRVTWVGVLLILLFPRVTFSR